ncbi:hypothetical protein BH20ACT5_BH20ACT5_10230 [soil metagenome]
MFGPRHTVASLLAAAALAAGLVACAGTVSGQAQYAGAGSSVPTATEPTETSTPEETSTAPTTTPAETTAEETTAAPTGTEDEGGSDPGGSGLTEEEQFACFIVPFADITADEQFGILQSGSDPNVTRETVAQAYDDAYFGVTIFLDPLPEGAVRDASEAYAQSLLDLSEDLRGTEDVSTEGVVLTKNTLLDECGLG